MDCLLFILIQLCTIQRNTISLLPQLHEWNSDMKVMISILIIIISDLLVCAVTYLPIYFDFYPIIDRRVFFRCNHYVIYHNLCHNCGWNAPCFGCNSAHRLEQSNTIKYKRFHYILFILKSIYSPFVSSKYHQYTI